MRKAGRISRSSFSVRDLWRSAQDGMGENLTAFKASGLMHLNDAHGFLSNGSKELEGRANHRGGGDPPCGPSN